MKLRWLHECLPQSNHLMLSYTNAFCRTGNKSQSTDNVQSVSGFDWSKFPLAGKFDRSIFILKNIEILHIVQLFTIFPIEDFLIVETQAEMKWNCCLQITQWHWCHATFSHFKSHIIDFPVSSWEKPCMCFGKTSFLVHLEVVYMGYWPSAR